MEALIEVMISTPDSIFSAMAAAAFSLAALGVILSIYAKRVINAIKREEHEPAAEPAKLAVKAVPKPEPAVRPVPKAEPEEQKEEFEQESLDLIFARRSSMVQCKYCETINPPGAACCCACGKHLDKE